MTPKSRLTRLHRQFHTHRRRLNQIVAEMGRLSEEIIEGGYRVYNPNDTFDEFASSCPEFEDNLSTEEPKWSNVIRYFIEEGWEEDEQ